MKIIFFAGGSGTRFWPISRQKYPKQFQPLINNESTLQRHLNNVTPVYGWENVYVQTTEELGPMVTNNFPALPMHHLITEPDRRDVEPAVALAMLKVSKLASVNEPVAILWSDNIVGNKENFLKALSAAEALIKENGERIIFLGEKPTYPNENLGWIEMGKEVAEKNGLKVYERKSFTYRPDLAKAQEWFKAQTHLWNPGYFVTTPGFILKQFESLQPEMYKQLQEIGEALDIDSEKEVLKQIYPQLQSISFDDAILEKLDNKQTLVLAGEYKWSDPGTLYALKQFLQEKQTDNVTKGLVYAYDTKDSLVYNFVQKQLVTTVGLDGFIVINTPDAVLVCHKDQIPNIKKMLKEFEGTELEKYL